MATLVHAAFETTGASTRKFLTVLIGLAIMMAIIMAPSPAGLSPAGQRVIAVMAFRGNPLWGECGGAPVPVDSRARLFTRWDRSGADPWNGEGHTARAQRLLEQRLAVCRGRPCDGGSDHQHGAREAGGL